MATEQVNETVVIKRILTQLDKLPGLIDKVRVLEYVRSRIASLSPTIPVAVSLLGNSANSIAVDQFSVAGSTSFSTAGGNSSIAIECEPRSGGRVGLLARPSTGDF